MAGEPEEPKSFDVKHVPVVSPAPFPYSITNQSEALWHNQRLIEPTSPILGNQLVSFIKESDLHPQEISAHILSFSEGFHSNVTISCLAYFNSIMPGLEEFQHRYRANEIPRSANGWTEVEVSSIPLEVLVPLHEPYQQYLEDGANYHSFEGAALAKDSALRLASRYQEMKHNCPSVLSVLKDNNQWDSYLPMRLRRLLELNAEISSAESAYPRLQHSINGYLRSIYDRLLDKENLEELLASAYEAQVEWIELKDKGTTRLSFIEYLVLIIKENGFTTEDALITLCYTSRNMPNLDVEYAHSAEKALLLEVYFWKIKALHDDMMNRHFSSVFPNHRFQKNPMLYHYATATYLAYRVRKAGYFGLTSTGVAFASKAAYKAHKYYHALSKDLISKEGLNGMRDLLKRQSSMSGIVAGLVGGQWGTSLALTEINNQRIEKCRAFLQL